MVTDRDQPGTLATTQKRGARRTAWIAGAVAVAIFVFSILSMLKTH